MQDISPPYTHFQETIFWKSIKISCVELPVGSMTPEINSFHSVSTYILTIFQITSIFLECGDKREGDSLEKPPISEFFTHLHSYPISHEMTIPKRKNLTVMKSNQHFFTWTKGRHEKNDNFYLARASIKNSINFHFFKEILSLQN